MSRNGSCPRNSASSYSYSNKGYHNRGPKSTAKTHNWNEGEIAYLKASDCYKPDDWRKLALNPERRFGASNHPVIILKKGKATPNGHFYLVTTVSAYCSGAENDYLPPWCQNVHNSKDKNDFRSFNGSELVNDRRKALDLEPGQSMPKPKASWVYIQSLFIVPESVLGPFNKSPVQLRVAQESLRDLVGHMEQRCRSWKRHVGDARMCAGGEQLKAPLAPTKALPVVKTTTVAEVAQVAAPSVPLAHKRSWATIAKGDGAEPTASASTTIHSRTCKPKMLNHLKSAAVCTPVVA